LPHHQLLLIVLAVVVILIIISLNRKDNYNGSSSFEVGSKSQSNDSYSKKSINNFIDYHKEFLMRECAHCSTFGEYSGKNLEICKAVCILSGI
jgi:hypothetical protein